MWMRVYRSTGALCVMLAVLPGCWSPPEVTLDQLDDGLVWMFPGVEGGPWHMEQPYRALRDGGVTAAIRIHDWRNPLGSLANLADEAKNRADARRIAEQIAEYQRERRAAPVDLVGYSGGGGVAIMVAEALPDGVQLRNVVLVQPAVSPDYDLAPALRNVSGKLVNYYSWGDWLVLGLGTATFGTMDRRFTASAGMIGFDVAKAAAEPSLAARVQQHEWSPAALDAGHLGGHLGLIGYEWNRRFVAPHLRSEGNAAAERAAAALVE